MHLQVQTWCIVFAAVGAGTMVCGTLQQFAFTLMGQKLTRRLRVLLMKALLKQVALAAVMLPSNFDTFQLAFTLMDVKLTRRLTVLTMSTLLKQVPATALVCALKFGHR